MRQWVDACLEKPADTFSRNEAEFQMVREIGGDAVPYLIKAIQRKPGWPARIYGKTWNNLPAYVARRLPKPKDPNSIRIRVYLALAALGFVARPGLPVLIENSDTEQRFARFRSLHAYGAWAGGEDSSASAD